ncbi:MAG: hypothetical protein JW787_12050 [Sedimentisphaerales bacterium]|nr:hypothetical protein [Sedimentisphaerales bacterium]
MANLLERYFKETSLRIPTHPVLNNQDLPEPEYPVHEYFDPVERVRDNDILISVEERWKLERTLWRLSSNELPYISFPINSDERKLLDGGIREAGFDVFAFYKSRRYIDNRPYIGKWGIFYLEHGITRIRELIEETYPGYSSINIAYRFLREHERFHFKFDLYSLSAEAKIGRSLYDPLKRAFRNHRIYQVEEALSNHYAWEWARQKNVGLDEFAYDFMKIQPGAYARFDENKIELGGELAANLLDLNLSSTARREDQSLWIGTVPEELLRRQLCPEYFVRPVDLTTWISPAWKLPEVNEITESRSVVKLLAKKYASLKPLWENTKRKLIEDPTRNGLNFKPWPEIPNHWSVRINLNFRAHLHPIQPGKWEADELGPHKSLGHG